MTTIQVQDLLNQLREKNFWGSIRIVVQSGEIVNVEILQTIKHKVDGEDVMVVVTG